MTRFSSSASAPTSPWWSSETAMVSLKPVVQMPFSERDTELPWEVAKFPPGHFLPLSEKLSLPEVGAVVALLLRYNRLMESRNLDTSLHEIINAKSLVIPGGIGVYKEEKISLFPGCCCGLESWRQWEQFLSTDDDPWCGHDPEMFFKKTESNIQIDQTINKSKCTVKISITHYQKQLREVETSLSNFCYLLEAWGYDLGFNEISRVVSQFAKSFDVRK